MPYRVFVGMLLLALPLVGGLAEVKVEPNLEKRSELALLNADAAVTAAKTAYTAGDTNAFSTAIDEVLASVELSVQSLKETGKRPRRSPKYFKRAEMTIRKLLKRLGALETDVTLEDRGAIKTAAARIHEIHDQLVVDIMTKK